MGALLWWKKMSKFGKKMEKWIPGNPLCFVSFTLRRRFLLCLVRWRRERISNKSLALDVEAEIYNYAKSNLAIINIFIKEPYSKRFRKTEKMSRIAYIASSGGLLGLCMGFSFVSLAEILYHCFICVSIFFKKSSKSTHMMKELYIGRNSGNNRK